MVVDWKETGGGWGFDEDLKVKVAKNLGKE